MADEAAAAAAVVVEEMAKQVGGELQGGSSNVAWVKWTGNLKYNHDEPKHGKIIQERRDDHGGTIAVMKKDAAMLGAEHTVRLTSGDQTIAEVFLATFYSGAQPQARLTYGDQHFAVKTLEAYGSTALLLALI